MRVVVKMIFPLKTVVVINFIARWDYRKNKQHAAGHFVVLLCKNYANREDFAQSTRFISPAGAQTEVCGTTAL